MRRLVREHVLAALHRQQAQLERLIVERLVYPDAFPLHFSQSTVSIREIGRVQIVPQFQADYPPVDVSVGLRVAVTATARRRAPVRGVRSAAVPEALLGRRTIVIDVEIDALGVAVGSGYELRPREAQLMAWWSSL